MEARAEAPLGERVAVLNFCDKRVWQCQRPFSDACSDENNNCVRKRLGGWVRDRDLSSGRCV